VPSPTARKITWGDGSDTIELYLPDENLDIHAPASTLTVNVDQSTFVVVKLKRSTLGSGGTIFVRLKVAVTPSSD
jgi:hypothetical protein